jgi:hypothetical protein
LKRNQIFGFILIALVIITVGILIYGPSLASQELDEAATEEIEKLSADIPNNQELYRQFYQQAGTDSLDVKGNELIATVAKIDGYTNYMWIRLDSAANRRTNKNHNFLVKEGHAKNYGLHLENAEELLNSIVPDMPDSVKLNARYYQPAHFEGNPRVIQKHLMEWMIRLRKAEAFALKYAIES